MDGDTNGAGMAVFANTNSSISATAGTTLSTSTSFPWTSPSGLLVEVNGANSNLYVNNFTSAAATGAMGANGFNSITLGAHSIFFGGGSNWIGTIAEVITYNSVLSSGSKTKLRQYLNARYGLSIS